MPTDPSPLLGMAVQAKAKRGPLDYVMDALRVDTRERLHNDTLAEAIAAIPEQTREERYAVSLAEYTHVTEGAIREVYSHSSDPFWTEQMADKVVLIIKLGLALSHAGLASVECEEEMRACAEVLGLPRGNIDVGFRTMTITFGLGHAHVVTVDEGFAIHQLNDVHELAKCLQADFANHAGTDEEQTILRFTQLIDSIMARDAPYSNLLYELADTTYRATAVYALFDGVHSDMFLTAGLSIVVKLLMRLLAYLRMPAGLNDFTFAFLVGLIVPLASVAIGLPQCRSAILYLSLLCIELPGGDLLIGAYELSLGNMVGATRMVRCISTIAYLGLALSMGWIVHGFFEGADQTSDFTLPTSQADCAVGSNWLQINAYNQLAYGVANSVLLGMRVREIPICLLYFIATTVLAGAVTEFVPQFPSFVGNVIITFIGGNFACFHEFWLGVPYTVPLTPIFLNLAPGMPALVAIVEHMNAMELGQVPQGDPWLDLLMQGVTYGLGASLAIELWRPILAAQQTKNVKSSIQKLDVVRSLSSRMRTTPPSDGGEDGGQPAKTSPPHVTLAAVATNSKKSLLAGRLRSAFDKGTPATHDALAK